ncbi:hypothetical protein CHS0354_038955 [Potamilus streckersoni]|uniref:Major facilitator superfamily (MFS) profile domain-containing protein n=1 Tax=Potamilus streckersoni TaxID=2493646 RepID=A0AAE0S1H2_9BIVA|nr:hypothetical protein CHS0354_038955 [Potamilus streckersoni]
MDDHEPLIKEPLLPVDLLKRKTGSSVRQYVVGPLIFLFFLGFMMSYYTITEYVQHEIHEREFKSKNLTNGNDTGSLCSVNTSNPVYETDAYVQSIAAEWILFYSLAGSIPAIFANLILGSWSDSFGRKFLFMVGITGTFIRTTFSSFIIHYKLDFKFFLIGYFVEGVTGLYLAPLQASFAYVADITATGKSRTMGLVALELMMGLALTLASLLGGLLIQHFGYLIPMVTSAGSLVICALIVLTVLPESYIMDRPQKRTSLISTISNSFRFYIEEGPRRLKWKYRILLAAYVFHVTSYLGRLGTETLYQLAVPFCWSPEKIGWYGAIRNAGMCLFGLPAVKFLQSCMSDTKIALIGILSYTACFLFTAFATNDTLLWFDKASDNAQVFFSYLRIPSPPRPHTRTCFKK